jgi:hypothetical protein
MEHQLDATITVLLIFKMSSTRFGQVFAHLQERKTEIFLQHMVHRAFNNLSTLEGKKAMSGLKQVCACWDMS